jgi:post-segregation antitoxin (ccd killing protein)
MPRGNPAVKLAVTIESGVHAEVVELARRDGVSVSAWMTEAARRAIRLRDGLAAVAEWEEEHGALTAREMAAARERVRSAHAPRRPRRKRA